MGRHPVAIGQGGAPVGGALGGRRCGRMRDERARRLPGSCRRGSTSCVQSPPECLGPCPLPRCHACPLPRAAVAMLAANAGQPASAHPSYAPLLSFPFLSSPRSPPAHPPVYEQRERGVAGGVDQHQRTQHKVGILRELRGLRGTRAQARHFVLSAKHHNSVVHAWPPRYVSSCEPPPCWAIQAPPSCQGPADRLAHACM